MAAITVYLRTDYKREDSIYPVYLSFRIGTKRIRVNTGVTCLEDRWDESTRRIKGRTEEIKEKNLIIANDVAFINNIFVKYKLNHQILTEALFLREWENRASSTDVIGYISNRCVYKYNKGDISKSTYISQKVIVSDLRAFRPVLAFFDVDEPTLKDFRTFLSKRGNSINTIDKKFRQLHAYFADAVKDKLIDHNPVDLIEKRTTAVEVDYLDEGDLLKLFELYSSGTLPPTQLSVLRMFLLACLTGLRISDALTLEMEHLRNGYIVKRMVKTTRTSGEQTRIPITRSIQKLIEQANPQQELGLIFRDSFSAPVINRTLKEVARIAELSKLISFKTGRHTFGYLYYKRTKDLLALKRLMGHSKIEQTLIYAHLNDEDILQGMTAYDTFTLPE